MGNVLVENQSLQDIADSIRSKNGTQTKYKPGEMSAAIDAISGGGITPTGTISITSNNTYDVTQYASASVNVPQGITPTGTKSITANGTGLDVAAYAYADVAVPNSYAAGDEGKVVSNGALVAQTSDSVTQNGTVDTTLINSLTVNVSSSGGTSAWMDADEPTDNKLHIWIDLTGIGYKVKPQLGSTTGNINWGDGNSQSNVALNTTHTYASQGVYEIVVDWSGTLNIPDNNLLVTCEDSNTYYLARQMIRRIYVPSTVGSIGNNKLQNSYLIEKATLKNQGALGTYVFQNATGLKEIVISEGVTTIGTSCYQNAISASKVDVPSTCTSIAANAFNGVRAYEWHFRSATPPALGNSNAFGSTESSAKFYVPAASVSTYQSASIWSSYSSRILAEP